MRTLNRIAAIVSAIGALGAMPASVAASATAIAAAATSPLHSTDVVGGGFASDGMVAARLVSVKDASMFASATANTGAHFVIAAIQLKNVSDVALPFYKIETSLVNGNKRVASGKFYDTKGGELGTGNATPGEILNYLDVFEIGDN